MPDLRTTDPTVRTCGPEPGPVHPACGHRGGGSEYVRAQLLTCPTHVLSPTPVLPPSPPARLLLQPPGAHRARQDRERLEDRTKWRWPLLRKPCAARCYRRHYSPALSLVSLVSPAWQGSCVSSSETRHGLGGQAHGKARSQGRPSSSVLLPEACGPGAAAREKDGPSAVCIPASSLPAKMGLRTRI